MSCPACGMDLIHTIGCGHKEMAELKTQAEVLYLDNVTLSETADRLREALEASTDLLVRVEKAFSEAWCIDWSDIPKQVEKNRAALEAKP